MTTGWCSGNPPRSMGRPRHSVSACGREYSPPSTRPVRATVAEDPFAEEDPFQVSSDKHAAEVLKTGVLGWVTDFGANVTSAEATLATALSRTLDAKSNIVLAGLPNALAEAQKIIRELDRSDALPELKEY